MKKAFNEYPWEHISNSSFDLCATPPPLRAQVLELPLCAQVLALAISNLCGSASTCAPEVLPLAPAEVLALPHKAQVLELALAEVLELPHEAEVLALSRAQLGGVAHTLIRTPRP